MEILSKLNKIYQNFVEIYWFHEEIAHFESAHQ